MSIFGAKNFEKNTVKNDTSKIDTPKIDTFFEF